MAPIRYSLLEQLLPGEEQKTHFFEPDLISGSVYYAVCGECSPYLTSRVVGCHDFHLDDNVLFYLEFRPLDNTTTILLRAIDGAVHILPLQHSPLTSRRSNECEGIPVIRWTPTEQTLIQLRPDDAIVVGTRRFTLIHELVDRVQVASSPVHGPTVVDLGSNDDEQAEGEGGDTDKYARSTAPPAVMVQNSMDEYVRDTSNIPLPGTTTIASTPHLQSFSDERVLDTPALSTRHTDPSLDGNLIKSNLLDKAMEDEKDSQTSTSDPRRKEVLGEIHNGSRKESMHRSEPRASDDSEITKSLDSEIVMDRVVKQEDESAYGTTALDSEVGSPEEAVYEQHTPRDDSDNERESTPAEAGTVLPNIVSDSQIKIGVGRLLSAADDGEASTSSDEGSQDNLDGDRFGPYGKDQPEATPAEIAPLPLSPPFQVQGFDEPKEGHQHEDETSEARSVAQVEGDNIEDAFRSKYNVYHSTNRSSKGSPRDKSLLTPVTRSTRKRKSPPSAEPSNRSGTKRRRPTIRSEYSDESAIRVLPPQRAADGQRTPAQSSTATESTPSRTGTRHNSAPEIIAQYNGDPPSIAYSNSNIPSKPHLLKFLRGQKAKKVETVSEDGSNFLCVGKGELKKTTKLILSIALGKTIVTDTWVVDSSQAGVLLDPSSYLPSDPAREKLWGFRLTEAIERGKQGVQVFGGWTIYITPSLKKELNDPKELRQIALAAGAHDVILHGPTKAAKNATEKSLVLAASENDDAAASLIKKGWMLYDKEIVSLSMLRGTLMIESDEFKLDTQISSQKSNSRKRAR